MSILYDMRLGDLVKSKLFNNGLLLKDSLDKDPLLSANFTTGTYKASGAAKTFADLFTFTRAGKAWLVKDTGLQEYAADVPRFDNGLLIEQESTNYATGSSLGNTDGNSVASFVASDTFKPAVDTVLSVASNPNNVRTNRYTYVYPSTGVSALSAYFKPDNNTNDVGFDTMASNSRYLRYNLASGVLNTGTSGVGNKKATMYNGWAFLSVEDIPVFTSHIAYKCDVSADTLGMKLALRQLEVTRVSSYIKTTTAPVTRPADFIQTKVTGTTVTGDWDSTLTLSIVAGNLVHSGYGRIRSLEIN